VNLSFCHPAKFVRQYVDAATLMTGAVKAFCKDVKSHQYPSDQESYHLPKQLKNPPGCSICDTSGFLRSPRPSVKAQQQNQLQVNREW